MTFTNAIDPYPYVPVRHPYIGGTRWNFMKWADIPSALDEGRTYLRRLRLVQTPWFALYLHFIYLPDDDRDPHDHPCNFWALIVWGGYVEKVYRRVREHDFSSEIKQWRPGSIHKMPVTAAHQIQRLKPNTVTLCVFGRKQQDWGFWTKDGFVNWRDYNRAKFGVEDWRPRVEVDEFG